MRCQVRVVAPLAAALKPGWPGEQQAGSGAWAGGRLMWLRQVGRSGRPGLEADRIRRGGADGMAPAPEEFSEGLVEFSEGLVDFSEGLVDFSEGLVDFSEGLVEFSEFNLEFLKFEKINQVEELMMKRLGLCEMMVPRGAKACARDCTLK
ncbi:hypothetical protein SFRURICE_009612 [Spodoptera frugiperda]|nr:hypothetical protein SFRURICE_009612 [Spodoptera frugiperda]